MKKLTAVFVIFAMLVSAGIAEIGNVDSDTIYRVQEALNSAGYYCGEADGKSGKNTEKQIRAFRVSRGFSDDAVIDDDLLIALGLMENPEATVEVTAEPTVEVTPEPTAEANVEVMPEPTAEANVEVTPEPTAEMTAAPTEAPVAKDVEVTEEPTEVPVVTMAPVDVSIVDAMTGGETELADLVGMGFGEILTFVPGGELLRGDDVYCYSIAEDPYSCELYFPMTGSGNMGEKCIAAVLYQKAGVQSTFKYKYDDQSRTVIYPLSGGDVLSYDTGSRVPASFKIAECVPGMEYREANHALVKELWFHQNEYSNGDSVYYRRENRIVRLVYAGDRTALVLMY